MNIINKLKQETSIMTMAHDTVRAMDRYNETILFAADRYARGLVNYNQALSHVRNYG